MNTLNQLKKATVISLIVALIVCLGTLQNVQAVSPPPDGGYPGGNTAEGQSALFSLSTGTLNTAVGFFSLRSDTAGASNTAVGAAALFANTDSDNTAIGAEALFSNTGGGDNTAIGFQALFSNTIGLSNTAIGERALFSNTDGDNNVAIGDSALATNTHGSGNMAMGEGALDSNTSGSNNMALGNFSGAGIVTANNVICIGTTGADVSNTCFIGNIRGITPQNLNAVPVLIDSAGQLGTMNSSRRYKTDIKPMDKTSESILALKPVTFRYKVHTASTPQFGLIAEEVAEVNPNLVIYDDDGKPLTVRYEAVNAMLLNEFLKEHKTVREQKATIADLKSTVAQQQKGFESKLAKQEKQIAALTAGLQKVSARLEVSKPAPQTAVNNR
jgi:hypothetical protein